MSAMNIKLPNWKKQIQSFFLRDKTLLVVFAVIILVGAFLRTYGFSDLLIFKSDQARDAALMQSVLSGEQSMPLLGASIGGEDFYLGPASYYFQFLSAKLLSPIFTPSPEIFALPELVFGILTIPLFYLLTRKFFAPRISLWLMAIVSVSPLFVTFSRFAWNPNSLPFFTTLFLLSLISARESRGKKRLSLLVVGSFSLGIIAQLHFLAILGLGLGTVAYLIIYRPIKVWEVFMCITFFMLANTPIIIHEFQTQGKNMRGVIGITDTSNVRSDEKKIYEKIVRAYQENTRGMWLVATGLQNTDIIGTNGRTIKCDKKCQESLAVSIFAGLLYAAVIIYFIFVWTKTKVQTQKNRIGLIGIWVVTFGVCTIVLAYDLTLRYFLAVAPGLLIMIGYSVRSILDAKNKLVQYVAIGLAVLMVVIQLSITITFLTELKNAAVSNDQTQRDLRFGTESKVTLGQLRTIATVAENYFNNDNPVVIVGEVKYSKSLQYVVSQEYDKQGCFYRGDIDFPTEGFNILAVHYTDDEITPVESGQELKIGTLTAQFTKASNLLVRENTQQMTVPNNCLR